MIDQLSLKNFDKALFSSQRELVHHYISTHPKCTSRDIRAGTGLQQSNVAGRMNDLYRTLFIKKLDVVDGCYEVIATSPYSEKEYRNRLKDVKAGRSIRVRIEGDNNGLR